MYIEALSGRAREVGDTTSASASTSGAVTPLLQTGETREDAIDLDSPPETPEVIMVEAPIEEESDVGLVEVFKEEEAAIRHCDACAIDVAEHSWSTHVLSLPHLLAAEPGPNLVLPPHIALQGPGRRMLEATGWTQGEGLGLDGRGRPVPIRPVEKHDRLGIGLKLKPGERKKKLAIIGESGAKRKARQAKDKVSWQVRSALLLCDPDLSQILHSACTHTSEATSKPVHVAGVDVVESEGCWKGKLIDLASIPCTTAFTG